MRRPTYTLLVVLVVAGSVFTGCGGDDDDEPAATQSQPAETTATTEPTETTVEPLRGKDRVPALEEFIRSSYRLAVAEADESGQFNDEGLALLDDADEAWQEYVERAERPEPGIARIMVRAYSTYGLDSPADAAEAAEIIAQAEPSVQAYIELATHAARAGQARKADLAGQKAVELAKPSERAQVKQAVELARQTPVK